MVTTTPAASEEQHHSSPHHHHHGTVGRRLGSKVTLWRDWDDSEQEVEGQVQYWELFTDLLMVAAASAIADNFKESPNLDGLVEFVMLYTIIAGGWLLYTHHYTSRFVETSSLGHSVVLFFYLLGMAGTIVNASLETAQGFALAVILQRCSFLVMVMLAARSIPRARAFCWVLASVVVATVACMVGVVLWSEYAVVGLACVTAVDFFTEAVMMLSLRGNRLVPVNIEHSKDRLGVLVLVMLGETVISSTMSYREYTKEKEEEEESESSLDNTAGDSNSDMDGDSYYAVLSLSFLLIFMFTLLFFNMQPPIKDHAFRRSRFAGLAALVLNKTLGGVLLAVGVYIKLAVEAVALHEGELCIFGNRLLSISVGSALVILLLMRLCHYGGRIPRPTDPPPVRRLMYIWWGFFAVMSVMPFLFLNMQATPVTTLAVQSSILVVLCVVETCFTNTLEEHLPNEETAPLSASSRTTASYQATQ